jgi:hypothetical protein
MLLPLPTNTLILFLVIIVAIYITFLILPPLLELRKRKDTGPRKLAEAFTEGTAFS